MPSDAPAWPVRGIAETYELLTGPGSPFELSEAVVHGRRTAIYKHARPHLRAIFDDGAQWGDRTYIVYEGRRITYRAHRKAAQALGAVLHRRYGVAKGDRVAIAMRNLPEWSIAFWATAAIGAVVVPLNAWGTGPELEYGLTNSGARVLIADGERLERLKDHWSGLGLAGVVAVEAAPGSAGDRLEDLIGPESGYDALAEVDLAVPDLQPEDTAVILYTSGTTGRPKGAVVSQRNIMTCLLNAAFLPARAAVRRGDPPPAIGAPPRPRIHLQTMPFFHVGGCFGGLIPCHTSGTTLVLMRKWNAEQALHLMQTERITSFTSVPAVMWQLLEHPSFDQYDTSTLEAVSYGGAAAAPDLTLKVKRAFARVMPSNGYGMTETASASISNNGEDYLARPDSVGLALPVCETRVVADDESDVAPGTPGELWIRGANVVSGYWDAPEATASAFTDGWFRTGDIVRQDSDGFVYLLDRAKDMLIRGGENVYCVEVEDALFSHPAVLDAAVIGLPHRVLGEEVGAVIQLKPGAVASEAELKAHVAQRLAAFKVPVWFDFRDEELPRGATGKTQKSILRAEAVEKRGSSDR